MKAEYLNLVSVGRNSVIYLIIIGVGGLLIRMYYFPYGVPLRNDGLDYLSYAALTSQLGHFPEGWLLANNLWPAFLSIFFYFFGTDNFLDFVYIQRIVSVVLSVLTIIPLYFLCNRFFDKKLSLIGATMFAFEPRVILNSLLGITEPLFLLLGTTSLFFFLSNDRKALYISFFVAGLFSLVRYEGLLLVIPYSIMYFVRFKKERKFLRTYFLLLAIFILVLLPMAYIRLETGGKDGLFSHISAGPSYIIQHVVEGRPDPVGIDWIDTIQENREFHFFMKGLINFTKYIGFISIPFFLLIVPFGIFKIITKRFYKKTTIILVTLTFLIPSFYAYARDFQDIKYLLIIYPILCLLSLFTFNKIFDVLRKRRVFMFFLISCILISSLIYLNYKDLDYRHEIESFSIAKMVVSKASGINYYSESSYTKVAEVANKWPVISPPDFGGHVIRNIIRISTDDAKFAEEYIEKSKEKGLTHIVVDGFHEAAFLNDIFYNDEKYPYLIKEYDSFDDGFIYHVKIYRIDYEIFDKFMRSS